MNGVCVQVAAGLVTILYWLQPAEAQPSPSYQKLDAEVRAPRTLQIEPALLSRFPTTFSMALSSNGEQLRTVDIDGHVWQRPARPAAEAELLVDLNCEPACAVLSADACQVAFADAENTVTVLDLEMKQARFHDDTAHRTVALAFSPEVKRLAGVTVAGQVCVWDVASGKRLHQFAVEPSPVQTVAFSPDGRHLAIASYSRQVRLYSISHQPEAQASTGDQPASLSSRASVAAPSDRPSDPQPRVIHSGGSRVTACAFTPDGKQLVVATADGAAKVHDVAAGREAISLGAHPFAIWSMVFDRGGERMAAGSWDGTIKLWDTASWQPLQSVKKHEESVTSMIFDGDQGVASAGLDGRLLYWPSEVHSISPAGVIAGRDDSVWVATYSPDGKRLFVAGRGNRFELWDTQTNRVLLSGAGHPTTRCAAFSPDGQTLATGGDDHIIALREAGTGQTRATLHGHAGAVSAVLFADEGRTLISVCDGGDVKVWGAATGQEQASWREHRQQIYCAALSPDENWLITGGGNWTTGDPGELLVWQRRTGQVQARLSGHRLAVWSVVFMPNGNQILSSDSSGAVKLWNLDTLQEERTLQHAAWVRPLALSPDARTLAVGRGDGSIRLWDTTTWTEFASCDGNKSFMFWLQYSPDGNTLASGAVDGTVRFWRPELARPHERSEPKRK